MPQLPSFIRPRPPFDPLAAPISAFESETQAVIQKTAPFNEHAILYALALMVVVTLLLMSVVRLDRVVTSSGKVLSSHGSIFVQPLDRAIVSSVLVKTGDVVKKGQTLALLDPTFAAADLKDLEQKKKSFDALVARLAAEQAGRPYVADPSSSYGALQATIWRQRQVEYAQGVHDFDARIQSARSVIDRSRADVDGYRKRLALASEQEGMRKSLEQRGFGSRISVMAATDARLETERQMTEDQNLASQSQHDLVSLQAQRAVFINKWRDDLGTQLVQAENDLNDATQGLAKAQKTSELSKLVAPEDAVVLKVGKASIGSVIEPTSQSLEPLFTLTPLSGSLEAEVQVASRDIGFIRPGDKVRVKLDAFKFTSHGTLSGVIKTISEGSFTQTEDGQVVSPYFKVRVAFTRVKLQNVPASFRLIPGMTLQGDILIGSRTIMSYLLEGALRTGSEAMREP